MDFCPYDWQYVDVTDGLQWTISDLVAERIKEERGRLGLTTKTLADRCAALGAPHLTASVLMNIESGRKDSTGRRRRAITVDELLVIAYALEVSPLPMLLPELNVLYPVAGETVSSARAVYEWFIGELLPPLPGPGGTWTVSPEERERAWFEFNRKFSYGGSSGKPMTPQERVMHGGPNPPQDWQRRGLARARLERMPAHERWCISAPAQYLEFHKDDPGGGMAGAFALHKSIERGEQPSGAPAQYLADHKDEPDGGLAGALELLKADLPSIGINIEVDDDGNPEDQND